jgi:hypothetical protein
MIALDLALSFNNNCSSNSRKTKSKNNKNSIDPKYYVLKYNLNIVDTSNYEFEVRISKDFELLNKVKLPKCVNSNVCTIEISRTEAVDLAIESGLEEGFEIYNEGLVLDEETETFQWIIKNHLKKGPDRGETIYIDALSGKRIVKKDSKWLRHIIH